MNYWDSPSPFAKTVELERMQYLVQQEISASLVKDYANTPNIEILTNNIGNMIIARLRLDLASEKLETQHAVYPSNWIEGVKDAFYRWLSWPGGGGHMPWLADYLSAKYPVKLTTVKIEARAFYPGVSLPKERHFIRIEKWDDIGEYW